jgi:hypothetical protein
VTNIDRGTVPTLAGEPVYHCQALEEPRPEQRRRVTRRTAILGVAGAAAAAALLIALLSNGGHSRVFSSARNGYGGPTLVRVAAGYLDIAPSELRRRLRKGETLAEVIASKKGASQAGLIKAAYAANARAVKRQHLSPAVERTELTLLRSRLSASGSIAP